MTIDEARPAVAALADAVRALAPLVGALQRPVRVPVPAGARTAGHLGPGELLTHIARNLGVALVADPEAGADQTDAFEVVIHRWLEPLLGAAALDVPAELAGDVDKIVADTVAGSFDRYRSPVDVVADDGALLPVYTAGDPSAPAIVLASACGMPAELCEPWLTRLGRDHFVVTWESRGLFRPQEKFDDLAYDAGAQAEDVFAVMDHFGLRTAHLMGFCGGSVVGLAAAGRRPERISSLSLWHGAYELGPDSPKLDHHRNIQALMAMAAESRQAAAAVHSVFLQTMLGSAPLDMAHLVLYPFATPELFYRYCRVNGAITDIDVSPLLDHVPQPTLVVTSDDDNTANPLGSKHVAARLPDAVLQVEPHGNHLSLFKMGGRLDEVATGFLRRHAQR
ncbi:alpha/beta fold hydrolase [Catellatospora vulcania]|uniref:alpha/beta fold hydrolase n=1 Tax=Catellatospora vulcania TaxID=1460450 RepID=UPI0012D3F878|nr:alpha/beta hydrolase [Catellatospora vulcania]